MDSSLHGGDVVDYVSDINLLSLLAPFYSALVSSDVYMPLSTALFFQSYISAILALSTLYLFVKVSFSP